MMAVLIVVATLAAGAVGAVVRAAVVARSPRAGTAAVNLTGTALLSLVVLAHDRGVLDAGLAVVVGVGLSGSLTTFSGWMALLVDGFADRSLRTFVVDLLLPTITAVGLTVVVFAVVG